MCLRLFRNFVQSKIPGNSKRSKRTQAREAPNYGDAEKNLQIKPGDFEALNDQPQAETSVRTVDNTQKNEYPTLVHGTPIRKARAVQESRKLWDALPPISIHDREDVDVDPSKAYFSALPVELKLDILDQFRRDYTIPSGGVAYQTFTRFISQNSDNVKALKALRLCDREMCYLGLQSLFIVANLTPRQKSGPNWLALFEKNMLHTVAQHIKYITVYLDEESDSMMARVLRQLPNVRWVMLDLNLQAAALESIDVLRKYTDVIRLTTISSGPLPGCHMEANTQFIQAYGKNLKSLDLFNAWNNDPTDSLLRTIQDCCPSLENLYIYGTADTSLASILVDEPAWASRDTLKKAHFEACKEVDAWIVASIVELYPALVDINICSCGGPGDYDHANGKDEERAAILRQLKRMQRAPLESLRVVHATDIEFRHMCAIPTKKLVVFDPLDQMHLGTLLSQRTCFPGLETVELQYLKEPGQGNEAYQSIKSAVERRGHCRFIDSRQLNRSVAQFF